MEGPNLSIDVEYDEEQLEWLRSKKVCDKCQSIFDHWYARQDWASQRPNHTHHTLSGLQDSARMGCPICEMFLGSFEGEINVSEARLEEYPGRAVVDIEEDKPGSTLYRICLVYKAVVRKLYMLPYSSIDIFVAEPDHNTTVGAVSKYTNCPRSWQLARVWLKLCDESHDRCAERIMDRKLPTRLVDVELEQSQVHLCLTRGLPSNTPYLTLSHCWGRKAFATLTRANLETFCFAIPEAALSKTFKEAVEVTRELGFRYLWIDSLCIIQDDKDDWKQEAALMGNVYANSSLNLAAVDASDGDGGCFFWRESRPLKCWKVNLYDHEDAQTPRLWNCRMFGYNLSTENILGSRAWAFQERCLAPRTLSLGNELSWECREMEVSEILPNRFDHKTLAIPGTISSEWREAGAENLTACWSSIVLNYTEGELTFDSDKLVAISGIARFFARWLNARYLAGMWEEDLVKQLTWYASGNMRPPIQVYRAPSWSWASINNEVCLPQRIRQGTSFELVKVENARLTSLGSPFDEVTGGELTLRCQDLREGRVFQLRDGVFSVMDFERARFRFEAYPDHNPHNFDGKLFYLPTQLSNEFSGLDRWELWGLVLKCENLESYFRVGCFCVVGDDDIQSFVSYLRGKPVTMEELCQTPVFDSSDGDEKTGCLINIV